MKIKSLKLKDFRNYEFLKLDFDEHTNIFYGDNAQGKTNILEAVYLLGTSKSHRGSKDRDMIAFGREESHLELIFEKNAIEYKIDMHLKKNSPKGIAINKMPLRRASELFGMVHFVFFSPENLDIIKDGPGERRKFMDLELSGLDPLYLSDLTNYNRVLNQRNHLLKEIAMKPALCDTLDLWDEQLATYGNKIINRRSALIEQINSIIKGIHSKLTGEKEELVLFYEPSNKNTPLEEAIKRNRDKDLRYKSTNVGPHRDDICFMANDIDIRTYGSQGQQRTTALSLKLAEIEIIKAATKDHPVLLLDDVLSELDSKRQNYLLDSIGDIQTLITCTGLDEFISYRFKVNKLFHIKSGQVINEN